MLQTQEACLAYLEKIRWDGKPKCPYCESTNSTPIKKEHRYHCNSCFNSYSVTVGTIFHKTHIDLPRWFEAIKLILHSSTKIKVLQLAEVLGVNKNTASYMITRINYAISEESELIQKILTWDGGITKS
jgi:transposase-like protein